MLTCVSASSCFQVVFRQSGSELRNPVYKLDKMLTLDLECTMLARIVHHIKAGQTVLVRTRLELDNTFR